MGVTVKNVPIHEGGDYQIPISLCEPLTTTSITSLPVLTVILRYPFLIRGYFPISQKPTACCEYNNTSQTLQDYPYGGVTYIAIHGGILSLKKTSPRRSSAVGANTPILEVEVVDRIQLLLRFLTGYSRELSTVDSYQTPPSTNHEPQIRIRITPQSQHRMHVHKSQMVSGS